MRKVVKRSSEGCEDDNGDESSSDCGGGEAMSTVAE